MAPRRVPKDAAADGTVYFCYEHAADSFSGILDDKYSMKDADIKEFIQYDNPKLFKRLHELRFGSSDIPMSYHAQKTLRRSQIKYGSMPVGTSINQRQIREQHAFETLESVPQHKNDSKDYFNFEMLALQLKRHVQTCLLNGYSLLLRKLPSSSNPLWCDSPACPFDGLVFYDTYYLTLKRDMFPNAYTGLGEISNQTHYCLPCLEDTFDGKQDKSKDIVKRIAGAKLDGVDRCSIMEAATRLYHKGCSSVDAEASDGSHTTPNDPLNPHPVRDVEIRNKPIDDDGFAKNHCKTSKSASDPSDLLESHPFCMEDSKECYRKRSLSEWTEKLVLRQKSTNRSPSLLLSPTRYAMQHPGTPTARICYCHEADLGTEDLVRCTNKRCSVGLFHLRCVGVDSLFKDAQFLCRYCANEYHQNRSVIEDIERLMAQNDLTLKQDVQLNEHDIEDDDSIEIQADPTDIQPTFVLSTAPRWGKPINLQPLTDPTSGFSVQPSACYVHGNHNGLGQMDGFTAINTPPRTATHEHSATASSTSLFPGSTLTTFADLAPFITTEDLTRQENKVFEEWKRDLPPSRLVQFLMLREPCARDTADDSPTNEWFDLVNNERSDDVFGDNVRGRKRLSELLNDVEHNEEDDNAAS